MASPEWRNDGQVTVKADGAHVEHRGGAEHDVTACPDGAEVRVEHPMTIHLVQGGRDHDHSGHQDIGHTQ